MRDSTDQPESTGAERCRYVALLLCLPVLLPLLLVAGCLLMPVIAVGKCWSNRPIVAQHFDADRLGKLEVWDTEGAKLTLQSLWDQSSIVVVAFRHIG